MTVSLRVVLVRPHYAGNVGAVARAMANFGFRELVLVSPIASPADEEARRLAARATDVLDRARVVRTLQEAMADCTLVVGTSALTSTLPRRHAGTPGEVLPQLAGERSAVVFGPEPTGLSLEELGVCHHIVHVPTSDEYPALNLAQAAAIVLYEVRRLTQPAEVREESASFEEQDRMFEHLRRSLEAIHFLYGDKADALMGAFRHLLGRAKLSTMETKLLHGLARQILYVAGEEPPP